MTKQRICLCCSGLLPLTCIHHHTNCQAFRVGSLTIHSILTPNLPKIVYQMTMLMHMIWIGFMMTRMMMMCMIFNLPLIVLQTSQYQLNTRIINSWIILMWQFGCLSMITSRCKMQATFSIASADDLFHRNSLL